MNVIGPEQFAKKLLANTPWLDVRAPVEFREGSIPGAVNLPLLNDEERRLIGIEYKTKGQDAAIALGHHLIRGEVRRARTEGWANWLASHPSAGLYCFRGGLRSTTVRTWLSEAGLQVPLVTGGYKALRRFLLENLAAQVAQREFVVVTGPTGSGKTEFLRTSGRPFIDLEALAKHRGSAFGAWNVGQPAQIDFENALSLELLRLSESVPLDVPILLEDESRMIGRLAVPQNLFERIRTSAREVLAVPFETRVENIYQDYLLHPELGPAGDPARFDKFKAAVNAISRKLGGLRTQEILADLENSRREFETSRSFETNRVWIAKLLTWYYDPVYARGMRL